MHTDAPLSVVVGLAAVLAGCSPAREPVPASEVPPDSASVPPDSAVPEFVGAWEITPIGTRGPILAFALDSVADQAVYGHVLRSFAGDVVEPVDEFAPFQGRLAADSSATFTIFQQGYTSPVYQLRVRAAGDTLVLLEYRWGPNDQLAPGRRWRVTRIQ